MVVWTNRCGSGCLEFGLCPGAGRGSQDVSHVPGGSGGICGGGEGEGRCCAEGDAWGRSAGDAVVGDATADENDRLSFLKHYQEAHRLIHETPDKVLLTVGPTAWPLPFPIVKVDGAWHFDANEGAKELMYRRIGQNELDAIKVSHALYVAEKEYAAAGHDGNPAGVYAQRFRSTVGTENGLYWEAKEGEAESPAGVLVAQAASEGYESSHQTGKPTPFHGYFFRILKAQGPHARGGAKDYVKDGKMTGGFAIVAYPAEYRTSGVMTFIVGPDGKVYQKDLGDGTSEAAKAMTAYDPDSSWKLVH